MIFDPAKFGERLRELRKLRGFTQEGLASELNISRQHLRMLESGGRTCSIDLLIEIAQFFNVSTDYLLLGKELDRIEERKEILSVIDQLTEVAKKL